MFEAQKFMNAEDALGARDDPIVRKRKDTDDRWFYQMKHKVPNFSKTPKNKRMTTLLRPQHYGQTRALHG